jgi:hypothetical protein
MPLAKLVTIAALRASFLEQLHIEAESDAALELAYDEAYRFGEILFEREEEGGSKKEYDNLFNRFTVLEETIRCCHHAAKAVPTTQPTRQKRRKGRK